MFWYIFVFYRDLNKFFVVLLVWFIFDNCLEYYLNFNLKLLIGNKMEVICIVFWINLVFKMLKIVLKVYLLIVNLSLFIYVFGWIYNDDYLLLLWFISIFYWFLYNYSGFLY